MTVVFFHFSTYVFINAFNVKRKRALKEENLSKIQNAQFCIKKGVIIQADRWNPTRMPTKSYNVKYAVGDSSISN